MERKLKIALIILIMVLVIVVSFGGIYVKKLVSYNNILPDYNLGSELTGSRLTSLKVGDHVHEIIYDSEGNEVEEIPEGADESQYRKEEVPENSEESKTKENYIKSKEIMVNRLKSLGVADYEVRLNEDNGNIFVELDDGENTDTVLSDLIVSGKFEIIDTNDKTVLMTNDDLDNAKVLYNSATNGVNVYLSIQFNKEGKKKLEQISRDYLATSETEHEENEQSEESTEKTITMRINEEDFLSTHFDEVMPNGELTITIGNASTDSGQIDQYIQQAQYYAAILSNGELPLEYEVESNDYIQSIYANNTYLYVLLGITVFMIIVSIIYMIIRYKMLGVLSSIVYVATVALLLVIVRYVNANITLDTLIISIILIVINTYINCKVLKNIDKNDSREDVKGKIFGSYLKVIDLLIIILISAVVFTYNASSAISSMGVVLFWGIIIMALMNVLFTRTLLIDSRRK